MEIEVNLRFEMKGSALSSTFYISYPPQRYYKCFDNVENKFLPINPNDILRYSVDESQQHRSLYSNIAVR